MNNYKVGDKLISKKDWKLTINAMDEFAYEFIKGEVYVIKEVSKSFDLIFFEGSNATYINNIEDYFYTITEIRKKKLEKINTL